MLRALEPDPHGLRLRQLVQRFRAEVATLQATLADLQADLDHWQREAAIARLAGRDDADLLATHCRLLHAECDELAVELAHARLAVVGACGELAGLWPDGPATSVA